MVAPERSGRQSSADASATDPSTREQDDIDEKATATTIVPTHDSPSVNPPTKTNGASTPITAMDGEPLPTGDAKAPPAVSQAPKEQASKEVTDTSTQSSAAPYGTRSRNRAGASRPNYAEDRELDAEFENTPSVPPPPTKDRSGRRSTTGAALAAQEAGSGSGDAVKPSGSSRKAAAGTAVSDLIDSNHVARSHSKEPIPGTSSFSAKPGAVTSAPIPTSKKRKAGGQSTSGTTSAPAQNGVAGPTAQTSSRGTANQPLICLGFRETNMLSFETSGARLVKGKLHADDGTILTANDHVYLVCEPPGEPYYLGRIMEFLHLNNEPSQPVDALRLNWYYRAKDIGRKANDTRQVFASMHSDISPLTALRGKCEIKHRSQVDNLDELRRSPNHFWYEKLYDRYIHRYYEVIPTKHVINVPDKVKMVLDDRWKYILVETGRGKELTSAVKSCRRCTRYCATNDSVDCAVCHNTYHMSCVNPPLLKKPSRGFAWACGPCSKVQEKKLEARNTPNLNGLGADIEDEEMNDEDDELPIPSPDNEEDLRTGQTTPPKDVDAEYAIHPGTAEQIHQASLWPFRYLGIHCRVEDALDYDDRIYPRASSRLGPRHQANIAPWPGRPVEYVKAVEIKKKYIKGGSQKKGSKMTEETIAAIEADKIERENRPKWVMDEPPGYIHRGDDFSNDDPRNTAKLLFRIPEVGEDLNDIPERGMDEPPSKHLDSSQYEQIVDDYMAQAKKLAKPLGLPDLSTNLLDVALETLYVHDFDAEKALTALSSFDRKVFKEPELSATELKKFEEGVTKYGSEWHSIKKHVKTMSAANVVRFYYTWKKTDRGKQVWGNYSGRKGKKEAKKAEPNTNGKLQDDVADDHDDSAFDNDKAYAKKRGFQCKFCSTRTSRQWRRSPNTPAGTTVPENPSAKGNSKDKGSQLVVALCRRCAELWRRYAIQWEDVEEAAKKVAQGGGRGWKRRIDEEVLRELIAANEVTNNPPTPPTIAVDDGPIFTPLNTPGPEPPRKKVKGTVEHADQHAVEVTNAATVKKKAVIEKAPVPTPPPPIPEPPKPKILPCFVCRQMEPMEQHLCCKDCRMSVHRTCYGVVEEARSDGRWVCAMCSNDKNPQVSISYKCMLCPVESTQHDFVDAPKQIQTKKRSEKDREKERIEREVAIKNAGYFLQKQVEANKPLNPREPLKRTANNNWVHVTCAVFTPEVKFGNAKALEPSEGIPSIPSSRYDDLCKVCKKTGGACVFCQACRHPIHIECANQAGHLLGFDVAPVKSSRRDQVNIVSINGEVGTMTAAVWCREHVPKTIVHSLNEIDADTKLTALQIYAQNFKQADLTLTGTVRKATLINQSTKAVLPSTHSLNTARRASTTNGAHISSRASLSNISIKEEEGPLEMSAIALSKLEKSCITCGVDVTPKWYSYIDQEPEAEMIAKREPSSTDSMDLRIVAEHAGEIDNRSHIALAVAALHQNKCPSDSSSASLQCHKCYIKKARREPSPVPIIQAPAPRKESAAQPLTTAPSSSVLGPPIVEAPNLDVPQPPSVPHYAWPLQRPYQPPPPPQPTATYNDWTQPAPAQSIPVPQGIHLNGHPPPNLMGNGGNPQMNGQAPIRPQPPIHHSPHQNGHLHPVPNGYPPSPHRGLASSTIQLQNGGFGSYATTRPGYQHLTDGGPPPRAPEHPFTQPNAPLHTRPPFNGPHGSPSMHRDPLVSGRDGHPNSNNNTRTHDGPVNGGASASPSLRNLLS